MAHTHLELMPPHPLRPGYDRTTERGSLPDLFQRRLEPANFNTAYFTALAQRLQDAANRAPDDENLRYMLAFVLLQNNADLATVTRAAALLDATTIPGGRRLLELIAGITARASTRPSAGRTVTRVNWSINNKCPMSCTGCYNPFVTDQITYEQALTIVDKLADHGTTDLVLAGGDPLLWPPIFDIVDHATTAGIRVALDTTGYTLTPDKLQRLALLSSLRLPLDGTTPAVQRAFRHSRDRDLPTRFRQSLQMCDDAGFHKVRVHTVASQANITDLAAIADTVLSHPSVRQWVIFQWWGRRAPKALTQTMAIDTDAIKDELSQIRDRHPDREIILAETSHREFLNWMIQSSGQVVTFGSGPEEEFLIGNLLTDEVHDIAAHPILDFDAMSRGVPVTPRT
ncbi:radical SAM protein [Streptomyces sp. RerS4]|uniref:radical SAM protein n=1 Tax=Streptomyces sp. RerS4 TaxID=2942449 RepID=UPI00201CAAFA|nr:radical SAM protein [Streptomyces sp. RerS4]UQW99108.1 radical SAM protein [Streptomyces sp. RerS4]